MSHRALILSVALHAGLLLLVGKWLSASAGSGDPGAGVSFSAADGLLVEIAPASLPADPLPSPPDFAPAAPALDPPSVPVEILTSRTSPLTGPPALPPKASPVKSAVASAKSGRAAGSNGSTRGHVPGPGLAGAGRDGGYVPASFRLRYKPPYPQEARARRLEGTVLLLVSLDATGHVTAAAVHRTCGHRILDRTALDAVRTWLFDPARQNGTAIATQVEIPVRFRFEERTRIRA